MTISTDYYLEQIQFAQSENKLIEIIENIYKLGYDEGYHKGVNDFGDF